MPRTCLALLFSFVGAPAVMAASPESKASPDPRTLVIPSTDRSRAHELVQQLGSEEFAAREEAEQALAAMGRLARPALLEGASSDPSPEVRARCESLLPRASALDMKARLEVFLADAEGKYEHDLPGWNQFRAVVCPDFNLFGFVISSDPKMKKAARDVFAELIASPTNRMVVMATAAGENELNAVAINRRLELVAQRPVRGGFGPGPIAAAGGRREVVAEDVAALLFAETLALQTASRMPRQANLVNVQVQSGFMTQVGNDTDKGRVYKAILLAWYDSRTNPYELYWAVSQAERQGYNAQALRMAIRLFTSTGAPSVYRAQAASVLARLGDKDQIPLLEKAFEDAATISAVVRVVGANREQREVQVRDMALAMAIQLSGQKPEEFGFESNTYVGVANLSVYLPEGKRADAFKKWKEWRAVNK